MASGIDESFKIRFESEQSILTKLLTIGNTAATRRKQASAAKKSGTAIVERNGVELTSGELNSLNRLFRIGKSGFDLASSRCGLIGKEECEALALGFIESGVSAVLNVGSPRGGDFLDRQLQGSWAERVVENMKLRDLVIVKFGPSGAAMPGESSFKQTVRNFRLIALLEGKRPDLIAFDQATWERMTGPERELVRSWPTRPLREEDSPLLKRALCAIEVKNSGFHLETRKKFGGRPLSMPVKDEEIPDLKSWSDAGVPVVFVLVTFDEVFCMSFRRMLAAIERGFLYTKGDYVLDDKTGEKLFHRFVLNDGRHHCATATFPCDSKAVLKILPDGHVVPLIDYQPAESTDVDSEVFGREVEYFEEEGDGRAKT
jgi:hypothetical protein